jgi:hypothetical protein
VTIIDQLTARDIAPVTMDLYRDIHKGIRAELFALTAGAASLDPADALGRAALADHVHATVWLLTSHAEHEDGAVQPALEACLPELAEQVEADHHRLEAFFGEIAELAAEAGRADAVDPRFQVHRLHLAIARFTASYLTHQDLEETTIMPALESALGVDAMVGIHNQIIANISPEDMVRSLALMLPAMNIDDRTEMLGGMQAHAPAEAFAAVWSVAGSVLRHDDLAALAGRLGL